MPPFKSIACGQLYVRCTVRQCLLVGVANFVIDIAKATRARCRSAAAGADDERQEEKNEERHGGAVPGGSAAATVTIVGC